MFKKHKNNQGGMASIMFAMLMVIVISLLSIGFAVLVRNDQRQTLDKTLSNQASYAAESAINLKATALRNGPLVGINMPKNTDCTTDTNIVAPTATLFNNLPDVKITCLTWDATPSELRYQNVGIAPQIARILPASSNVNSILITWTPAVADPDVKIPGVGYSPNNGKLVLNIFPTLKIVAAGDNDITAARVSYINPNKDDAGFGTILSQAMPVGEQANIINAQCNSAGNICAVLLNGLPGGAWTPAIGGRLAISSLGKASNINVYAFTPTGVAPGIKFSQPIPADNTSAVDLKDAQFKIDATAKSKDVMKRIVANVAIESTTWRPGFGVLSDALCKNYAVDGLNNDWPPVAIKDSTGADIVGEQVHAVCQ
jgi:hypothetical protein